MTHFKFDRAYGMLALLLLTLAGSSLAQGTRPPCTINFASVEAGRNILTNRDDFIRVLSPFDRSARLKTDREITEKEFLEFVAKHAQAWKPEETNKIMTAWKEVEKQLIPFKLPMPGSIVYI